MVGGGRREHGYKLPVMYAAVDIHIEDVVQHGRILSQGDAKLARAKLDKAVAYSCQQRTHGNALETLPMFFALSLLGGLRYPLASALHGLAWCAGRFFWTRGYMTATPIERYSSPLAILVWTVRRLDFFAH